MRHRVAELVGPPAEKMWSPPSTRPPSHPAANADRLGYRSAFTVYDDTDLAPHRDDHGRARFRPAAPASRAVQAVISQAKSQLVDFETFAEDAPAGRTLSVSASPTSMRNYQARPSGATP